MNGDGLAPFGCLKTYLTLGSSPYVAPFSFSGMRTFSFALLPHTHTHTHTNTHTNTQKMPPFLPEDDPFSESRPSVSSSEEPIPARPARVSNSFLENEHSNALI